MRSFHQLEMPSPHGEEPVSALTVNPFWEVVDELRKTRMQAMNSRSALRHYKMIVGKE